MGLGLGLGMFLAELAYGCPPPALDRVQTHPVQPGETWETVAAEYNLLTATLLGMNRDRATRPLQPGQTLRIPPFNGIEVTVPTASTWVTLGEQYQVRADILFEVNGCPSTPPQRVFIPGVNWLVGGGDSAPAPSPSSPLGQVPLGTETTLVTGFGWQPHPTEERLVFNGGITLATATPGPVVAAGAGTVAYVGPHDTLGTLVVINHPQGFQTRYGLVSGVQVTVGQQVSQGTAIAEIIPPTPGDAFAYLHFEVRINSDLGWVARNPGNYLPTLMVR